MSKSNSAIWFSIFVAGLVAGSLFVIGLKYGISDEVDAAIFGIEQLCKVTGNTNNMVSYNCSILLPMMTGLSILITIVSVIVEIKRADNWIVGIMLYSFGWIVGFLWMLSNLK